MTDTRPPVSYGGPATVAGHITDPVTGEQVTVWTEPLTPDGFRGYRRRDGALVDLVDDEARELWPDAGIHMLTTSSGRVFVENHLDPHGWWIVNDVRYRGDRRPRSRLTAALVDLGAGLANGYPLLDVLAFSWATLRRCHQEARP